MTRPNELGGVGIGLAKKSLFSNKRNYPNTGLSGLKPGDGECSEGASQLKSTNGRRKARGHVDYCLKEARMEEKKKNSHSAEGLRQTNQTPKGGGKRGRVSGKKKPNKTDTIIKSNGSRHAGEVYSTIS